MKHIFFVTAVICAFCAQGAFADGMLIPARPEAPAFSVKYHKVEVTIKDQIAFTKIDQVFINEHSADMEATYIFPMPQDVAITNFVMFAGGNKPVETQLLKKDEARKIYESIVNQRKDPALLEYVGRNMIKASIFPLPAKGERRIQIEYSQILTMESGICEYYYTLNTEKLSNRPIENTDITIALETTKPIKAVYSPTHNVSVSRASDTAAGITYSEKQTRPDLDFVLYYSVSERELGLDMLTYKPASEDGYFIMMLAPSYSTPAETPKEVVFVLDNSGSMAGDKIKQAKDSLSFCLKSLRKNDKFNVLIFNNSVTAYKDAMVPAGGENIAAALKYVNSFNTSGGTNIKMALSEAVRMFSNSKSALKLVMFITDGIPTVEETDVKKILAGIKTTVQEPGIRVFPFGVGYDVDAYFLDRLAENHKGISEYVLPNEGIDTKISAFFTRIGDPVLYDITVTFGDSQAYDIYPVYLPDVFRGGQILILGRYKSAGETHIKVTGISGGEKVTYTYKGAFPETKLRESFISGLWASRKIGYLLDQIWEHGESGELVDGIIDLSRRYGIMTEYTSFLINEDGMAPPDRLRETAAANFKNAYKQSSGNWAVNQGVNRNGLKQQEQYNGNWVNNEQGQRVQIGGVKNVNGRTFYNRNGQWVDSQMKQGAQVTEVRNFSEEYFELTRRVNGMGKVQSLGSDVTVEVDGKFYRMK